MLKGVRGARSVGGGGGGNGGGRCLPGRQDDYGTGAWEGGGVLSGGGRVRLPFHWVPGGRRELPRMLPRLVTEQQGERGLKGGGSARCERVSAFRLGAGLRVHGVWPFWQGQGL